MTGTIERAFELARDGSCRSMEDIRHKLAREKYEGVSAHLAGQAIAKQLRAELVKHKPVGKGVD